MLPAALCAVLFTASAYQITRRLDLTLVLFAAFALLSLTAWKENWLLRWLNPAVNSMSDDFGNVRLLRSVLYNRLFWLLLLCGLCALSFLCVRRYGKGIFGSAARNLRKVYLPLLVVASLLSGYAVYTYQPFLDHSKAEIDMDSYYNITSVSYTHLAYRVLDYSPDGYFYFYIAVQPGLDYQSFAEESAEFFNDRFYAKNESMHCEAQSLESMVKEVNDMMGTMSTAIAVIAGISLLVGGIGVMNIMLVSVTERTSEIGLKKAIGARKKSILVQFLTEAAVQTSIGGVLGLSLIHISRGPGNHTL